MREIISADRNWLFSKNSGGQTSAMPKAGEEGWEQVDLPHCWNRFDGQDGGSDYVRGECWYEKELTLPERHPDSLVFLEIPAAATTAKVYVNGHLAASHEGGYSIFRAEITPFLHPSGCDRLSICVDNRPMEHVYPQTADFTFYGGLYRGVTMIITRKAHFDLEFYGASGLTVSSKIIGNGAEVTFHAFVKNASEGDYVEFMIYDEEGREKASVVRPAAEDTKAQLRLSRAHLWQGVEDPYLYTVSARLVRHNELQDEVETAFGIREFSVDPQKGFFLNGKPMPLRGVSRHQDKLEKGYALTYEDHLEDALIIRELGANTIRLAHYQHSQEFYDLCDEMGFILWAEIPFISNMSEAAGAHENCISQMKELIYQNYNHPSILFWGISNEITIGGTKPGLNDNLRDLNRLAHELDPTRLTTMAQVSMLPMEDEQNQITDVVSYNHYFGWYKGSFEDNEAWLDAFHEMHPDRALGISEYGCEGITAYHNDAPKAGDYSEEYQALYHEHMAKVIEERPWLWATHIWNMFDFGCDARDEGGVKGRNNKGLVSLDRQIYKDSFYLYKAYWNPEPMVHICGKRYGKRPGDSMTVKVYTNCPEVSLFVDGKLFGTRGKGKVLEFSDVPLGAGFTMIEAVGHGEVSDSTAFERVSEPYGPYYFEDKDNPSGVLNWFDDLDLSKNRPLEFKEGYYSIQDPVQTLMDHEQVSGILLDAMSSILKMPLKKSLISVMGDRSPQDLAAGMAGGEDVEAKLRYLNERLQEIKKD
ncbi:MAG: glycoside hydrolase family 2 protein [Lachnospiraceae bacterium]